MVMFRKDGLRVSCLLQTDVLVQLIEPPSPELGGKICMHLMIINSGGGEQ